MKGPLFHWGLVLRYSVYGALPFILAFWIGERLAGDAGFSAMIVGLAAVLPFYAVGWLAWQHFKQAKRMRDAGNGPARREDVNG